MIRKTNVQGLRDLKQKYRSHTHIDGIISPQDAELIRNELQLKERDEIGLRNLRDTIVMFSIIDNSEQDETSAFVHMIDTELWNRGYAV